MQASRRLTFSLKVTGLALVSGAAIGVLSASALARPDAGQTSSSGQVDTLTWALPAQIRGLDYTKSADVVSATVVSLGCETLLKYDRLGRLRPNLASAFRRPTATSYVYRVRKGVRFWDGTPLTAADVVYSLQRFASEKEGSQTAAFFSAVKSIRQTAPDEVTVRLSKPDPAFTYSAAITYIVQKRFWQANRKTIGTPKTLTMCTGPFRFTRFVPDESIDLTRFDEYWGGRPHIAKIALKFIVSDSTRLLAMRSGAIDGTFRIPQDQIDQWKRLRDATVKIAPPQETAYFSFDVASPPWNDVNVRKAVAYALDKRGLVNAALRGYGSPAPALPPPIQWANLMSAREVNSLYASLPQYTYNLAKAKQALARSRYPNGFTATLPYPDSRQILGKAALALSQSLKQIGITLNVKQITTDAWFNILYSHPKPMGLQVVSWDITYPDPSEITHFLLDGKFATPNAFNTSNYRNAAMDRLLAQQERAASAATRRSLMVRIIRQAARDLPYLPIWYQQVGMAIDSRYTYNDFGIWYIYTPWALSISPRR